MSKLIEFMNRVSPAGATSMGFLSRRNAAPPKRLALLATTGVPAENFPAADAVLVRPDGGKLTAAAAKEVKEALGAATWGLASDTDKAAALPKGCDFVVAPLTGLTAAAPSGGETGTLLELDSTLDDGLLRAAEDLPVDAVIVADALEDGGPLTWHRLMILAHVRHLIAKPIILPVPAGIGDADVKALWDAGFDGILVTAPAERIAALARTIAALPPRTPPKKARPDAVVPRTGGAAAQAAAEPEEPDEDDDWE